MLRSGKQQIEIIPLFFYLLKLLMSSKSFKFFVKERLKCVTFVVVS